MSYRISAPPAWMAALEYRALAERSQMSAAMPLLRRLPPGDGHRVLVLPGFSAGDGSTRPLRRLLNDLGYRAHGWGLGVNVGPTRGIIDGLVRRLDRVSGHGRTPVSIVGWSLGGIYARELARGRPPAVRQIITLGSPIQMTAVDQSSAQPMWDRLSRFHAPGFTRAIRDAHRPALPVPATSIYSHTDGVVNWRACLIERNEISENIRVFGSHCGLGFNSSVIFAVADRLAQPDGVWTPFSAPWCLRGAFPRSADLDRGRLPAA